MNTIIRLCLLLLLCINAHSQNQSNYIQINLNSTLNFLITSPNNIESDQTIQNALTIQVMSKASNCSIYARLNNLTYPSGFTVPSPFLKIDWTNDNSNKDYNLITAPIALNSTDQLLFSQKKMPSASNYYSYYYNLILSPPTYALVPGSYSFNILFTMTEP